jgi:hypothetical protein
MLLSDQPGVAAFTHRHFKVSPLSDGWQILVSRPTNDPDLETGTEVLAAETGAPVLAAFVCDGDCAELNLRVPGGASSVLHLSRSADERASGACSFEHSSASITKSADEVTATLASWAQAAGLDADPRRLRPVVTYDLERDGWRYANELVFDLLPALGFPPAGEPQPHPFDILERPYSEITSMFGLGAQARLRATFRSHPDCHDDPDYREQPWEAEAIKLDLDLWAAYHHPDTDVAAFEARIADVRTVYKLGREAIPPTPPHIGPDGQVVQNMASVMSQLYDGHLAGNINPPTRG